MMQNLRSGNHSPGRPDWTQLPSELLTEVFKHLSFDDLIAAETCCRSWYQTLKCPQDHKVWGVVLLDLDDVRERISTQSRQGVSETNLFLPTCRWLRSHSPGIHSLEIGMYHPEYIDFIAEEGEPAVFSVEQNRAAFAMLVASLSGCQIDIHINFTSKPEAWQLAGHLTALTKLDIYAAGPLQFHAAHLGQLQRLDSLQLTNVRVGDFDVPRGRGCS
ncbi:hypothetical protein WJX73_004288 [Symbiochloris irregularis]|uniref:F-box domain-containing protein n=1 Tax=Symbiochloris irregularis TaxID=706552 RepID=A0AAW1PYU9_9CHLO